MLVTLDELEHRRRYLNAAATLDRLLSLGVVPIINENDSVATEEIRFGDNDRLAARVAQAAGAGGVVLLSDIDGLYDRNPAQPGAQHLARVERSEEHTSELQSLMRISYAVFRLKKKNFAYSHNYQSTHKRPPIHITHFS